MVYAIVSEIDSRHEELSKKELTSIYFGGGTPSLLDKKDFDKIFEAISRHFHWNSATEITLEANPDDIDKSKLEILKAVGVNRLSIGIQSFDEADLKFMNRAHNAEEALRCIDLARKAGFEKLTADLIYGSPTTSIETWNKNIDKLLSYDLPHISAYCLTVEEGTALYNHVKSGKTKPVNQEAAIKHFEILIDKLQRSGYDHYEISNFAKPDYYAIHNTNYWRGYPYLGIGPGAHSFDGNSCRRWNISHNIKYIKALANNEKYWESETLSQIDKYNEYILTALRTMWGLDIEKLNSTYFTLWQDSQSAYRKLLSENLLQISDNNIVLTQKGKHLADNISMQLFSSKEDLFIS